jgi:hypothetical protein
MIDPGTARDLLGQRVRYLGACYEVVDLLDDGPALVLASLEDCVIQADQHGDARRRVPSTLTLPLRDRDGNPHPDLLGLERLAG